YLCGDLTHDFCRDGFSTASLSVYDGLSPFLIAQYRCSAPRGRVLRASVLEPVDKPPSRMALAMQGRPWLVFARICGFAIVLTSDPVNSDAIETHDAPPCTSAKK